MKHIVCLTVILSSIIVCSAAGQQPRGKQKPATEPNVMVPRLIRFGGVLRSEDGKPLRRTASVTFALYKEQKGGAPLWLETQNVGVGANGHYAALLGSTKLEGVPIELFTSGEAQWLGVPRIENASAVQG